MPWLINSAQLDKFRKDQKSVVILDATYFLPADNRDAREEHQQKHIGGARFFDIAEFNDTNSPLPNMLTHDEAIIQQKLNALGITNDHKIIFYDNSPLHTSCRALWMLKVFGHNPNLLYILDGGFAAWEKYGGKIESGMPPASPRQYNVDFQAHFLRTLMQMKTNLHHPTEQVVDMRHPVRFAGGKEHRPGVRSGHIPGAYSFPYFTMYEQDGTFKPLEKIRKQFTGVGVDLNTPIVTMCGSGISAPILNFILDLLNHEQHAVYNGSWCEWGAETLYHGEESLAERPVITSLDK